MRIAYILRKFCKYSETFIAHEIAELLRRGHEVRIFTPMLLAEPPYHPVVLENHLLERAVCFGEGGLTGMGGRGAGGTGRGGDRSVSLPCSPSVPLPPLLRARLRGEAESPPPGVTLEEELRRLLRLTSEVMAFAPDHLHAHFATEASHYAGFLRRLLGLPFSLTTHGYDIFRKAPADLAARMAGAAHLITVSEANRQAMCSLYGVPRERIHVIGCGVDLRYFCPSPDTDPELVLAIARLVPVKRLDVLLAACARLRDRGVPFRCVVVGEGEERPRLEGRRRQLELEGCVELVGAVSQAEVRGWLKRAAVVALTSDSEGLPVSLMEAAASGRPVVATAVGGVPELVAEGQTGFLVEPGDAVGLADALARLLQAHGLRQTMGKAARERAEARFGLERQVDRLLALWGGT